MIVAVWLKVVKKKEAAYGRNEERVSLYLLLFRNLPRSLYQGRQGTQRFGEFEKGMLE